MRGEPGVTVNPAIVYKPDGYRLDGARLMGRQAAGNGFPRVDEAEIVPAVTSLAKMGLVDLAKAGA
jgi:hypothetical protein